MKLRSALGALIAGTGLAGMAAQAATPDLDAEQARGKSLFNESCVYCHGPSGFATRALERRLGEDRALLEARDDLNPRYIELVVRRGLNSMPWYRRTELSDGELESIVAYLMRHEAQARQEPAR